MTWNKIADGKSICPDCNGILLETDWYEEGTWQCNKCNAMFKKE